jgi:hypothetical protein
MKMVPFLMRPAIRLWAIVGAPMRPQLRDEHGLDGERATPVVWAARTLVDVLRAGKGLGVEQGQQQRRTALEAN